MWLSSEFGVALKHLLTKPLKSFVVFVLIEFLNQQLLVVHIVVSIMILNAMNSNRQIPASMFVCKSNKKPNLNSLLTYESIDWPEVEAIRKVKDKRNNQKQLSVRTLQTCELFNAI